MSAQQQSKPTTKKGWLEVFMTGAKKGFYIGVEQIAPAMIFAYAIIEFLKITKLIDYITVLTGPIMKLFGLPGEAAVALGAAFFAKAAGAAAAANLYFDGILTAGQATILFPACILMGTLLGHYVRIVLVAGTNPKRHPLMFAVCLIDAAIAMFITRIILSIF